MSSPDPVQCPVCGWTGHPSDLERTGDDSACPACDQTIKFVE